MSAEKILITADKITGEHQYCSYVRAYFNAMDLGVGDTWVVYKYEGWINNKHHEFRKEYGIPEHITYNRKQQKEFEEYIWGRLEVNSEYRESYYENGRYYVPLKTFVAGNVIRQDLLDCEIRKIERKRVAEPIKLAFLKWWQQTRSQKYEKLIEGSKPVLIEDVAKYIAQQKG